MLRIAYEQQVDLLPAIQALAANVQAGQPQDVSALLTTAVQAIKDKVAAACASQQAIVAGYATATSQAPGPPDPTTGQPTTVIVQHPWHGKQIKFHPVQYVGRVRDGLLFIEAGVDYEVTGPPA